MPADLHSDPRVEVIEHRTSLLSKWVRILPRRALDLPSPTRWPRKGCASSCDSPTSTPPSLAVQIYPACLTDGTTGDFVNGNAFIHASVDIRGLPA